MTVETNQSGPLYMTPEELSMRLSIGLTTLEQWRYRGNKGPKWCKLGGLVRYRISDVETWERESEREPITAR